MAVDSFLKIEGVKGESEDAKHKGEIDVLSWSWGATQAGTTHTGSGGGAGKVSVKDLAVVKYVDRASPTLNNMCFSGSHLKQAVLTVRKAGGEALEYVKITMEDLIVSSVEINGSAGQERLTENVNFNFSRVKYDYTPQKADGSGDAAVTFGWDIAKNVKWG
ncbi:MAG TPA: type VI secretion system tube protein Hcp [Polyangiaceae bacterium]